MDRPRMNKYFHNFFVVFCPFVVAIVKHQAGFIVGWPSVLPKIQADNSTSLTVTDNDVQWLVSSTGMITIIGNLFTGLLVEFFGPTRTAKWTHIPVIVFCLFSAFTPYVSLLHLGRLGWSLASSVWGPLLPLLISELSDPSIRGSGMAVEEIAVSVGLLAMYVMVDQLYWVTATALCIVPGIIFFLLTFTLPESPFWLARHGFLQEAEETFIKLRFSKDDALQEMKDLTKYIEMTKQESIRDQVRLLKHRQNIIPILLVFSIFVLREIGGEYVIFSYTVYIIRSTDSRVDPFLFTVIIGVIRLVASIISAFLLDTMGRRPLIISTTVVCALSTTVYFIMQAQVSGASWVSLGAILVYSASYGLGIGPIPWGLLGEMIPTPVRSIGGSMCLSGYSLSIFITGYLFPITEAAIGIGNTFLIFAISLIALLVILIRFFPETKRRTLNSLQDEFKSKKNESRSQSENTTHMKSQLPRNELDSEQCEVTHL